MPGLPRLDRFEDFGSQILVEFRLVFRGVVAVVKTLDIGSVKKESILFEVTAEQIKTLFPLRRVGRGIADQVAEQVLDVDRRNREGDLTLFRRIPCQKSEEFCGLPESAAEAEKF